jgi:hypothetical protein
MTEFLEQHRLAVAPPVQRIPHHPEGLICWRMVLQRLKGARCGQYLRWPCPRCLSLCGARGALYPYRGIEVPLIEEHSVGGSREHAAHRGIDADHDHLATALAKEIQWMDEIAIARHDHERGQVRGLDRGFNRIHRKPDIGAVLARRYVDRLNALAIEIFGVDCEVGRRPRSVGASQHETPVFLGLLDDQ